MITIVENLQAYISYEKWQCNIVRYFQALQYCFMSLSYIYIICERGIKQEQETKFGFIILLQKQHTLCIQLK